MFSNGLISKKDFMFLNDLSIHQISSYFSASSVYKRRGYQIA